jgi:UPF0716 protein FxsA
MQRYSGLAGQRCPTFEVRYVLNSLRLALLLVFVAFPLLEIALLIRSGETIGFWPTIGLLIGAAVLGVVVIRRQGLSMVGRTLNAVNEGRLPFEPLLDGYLVVAAGFLLIVPGFLSDAIGLLLLVPPLRAWCIRRVWPGYSGASGTGTAGPRQPSRVIETTWERVDPDESGKTPGPKSDQ